MSVKIMAGLYEKSVTAKITFSNLKKVFIAIPNKESTLNYYFVDLSRASNITAVF